MPVISLSSGASFETDLEKSILESATLAKINLPYSCKLGRCNTCKCKVISGSTRAINAESGLSNLEKEQGWILSCVRAANSDLTIEVDDLSGVVIPQAKLTPCRISKIEYITSNVLQVFLKLPPSINFNYIPGQYIEVIGDGGVRRSYSIANAGFNNQLIELHIRAVENGKMSEYWFKKAKINDLLRINGPLGTFFLRESINRDVIFLATGTGIAPIKAILESLQDNHSNSPKSITVFWGGRKVDDLYFDVASLSGNHQYIPVLSQAPLDWIGMKGYVQDILVELKPDLNNVSVYACGSEPMINSARSKLLLANLPPKSFYSDAFVNSGTN